MVAPRKLSILGLALCAMAAGATVPAFPRYAAAAAGAPHVTVVGYPTYWPERNPDRDHVVRSLTLHIAGSNFVPGSKVRIAVVNTRRWDVISRGATLAQRAATIAVCGRESGREPKLCSRTNPRAGTIDYRVRLTSPPAAANLVVLYRSTGDPGLQGVTLR